MAHLHVMYVTAILVILLLICLIASGRKSCKGPYSFDAATTLPLRGLLALLIVAHHLAFRSNVFLNPFCYKLGVPVVAIFFFISGYGLCRSYLKKGQLYLDGFINKRMGKLLPKFIALTLVMIVCFHFLGSLSISEQLHELSKGWVPLPNSWFVYAIIYVYVTFYLCAITTESPKWIGMLLTGFILLYIFITHAILHFPGWWYISVISVSAGYFAALYEKHFDKIFSKRFALYTSLGAFLALSHYLSKKPLTPVVNIALTELWTIAVPMAVYVIVRTLGFFQWKWLRMLGIYSLEIYLVHGIWLLIGPRLGLADWGLWTFAYVASICSAVAMNKTYDLLTRRIGLEVSR